MRNATQAQARQVSHPEKITTAKEWGFLRRALGIRDLAEGRFTLLQICTFDVQQARAILRLRPKTPTRRHRAVPRKGP
jgi:hypothetical protein